MPARSAAGVPSLVSHAISVGAGLREMLAVSYPTELAVGGGAPRWRCAADGRARPRCLTEACDCAFARDFARPFPVDRCA